MEEGIWDFVVGRTWGWEGGDGVGRRAWGMGRRRWGGEKGMGDGEKGMGVGRRGWGGM